METKSTGKFLLSAPRKIRLVEDEIRGYSYPEAMDILRFIPRKGSRYIESVLKTARSNAVSLQKDLREEDLYIKKVYVDMGPTLKRFRPRARGRGMRRLKRMSHITIVLSNE